MYDIIYEMIGHTWSSNYTNEQQYVYYISGAVICILVVAFIDIIKTGFAAFTRR